MREIPKSPAPGAGPPLRGFRSNAKVCLFFLPLWSLPYSLSFFYLSLYLRECGVSDAQLGLLVTAGAGASILFSLLAAPVVDAIGRKKSTLIFDIAGSVLPFLIYAVSGSFAFAMIGTLLSNSSKIMNVGYYLLMTEDSGNGERAASFNVFNILVIASGLLVPVAGSLVESLGIVRAERWFLLFSVLAMTASALGRNHFATETATGRRLMEERQAGAPGLSFDPRSLARPYRAALSYIGSNRGAAAAVAANVLFYVYYIVGTNNSLYFAPFFADALGMDPSLVSVVGAVFSAGTLCAMLFFNPFLFRRMAPATCALLGAGVALAGFLPLVVLRRGMFVGALAAVGLSSVGYGILKSAIDASLATCFGEAGVGNQAGEEARAGVYSVANLLSSALGMGAGALCGLLYPRAPRTIPLISGLILAAICLTLAYAEISSRQSLRSRRIS